MRAADRREQQRVWLCGNDAVKASVDRHRFNEAFG
jgi:hypothetical protein